MHVQVCTQGGGGGYNCYIWLNVKGHSFIHTWSVFNLYVCVYVCMYIGIYMYLIYTHICMYTYCIHNCSITVSYSLCMCKVQKPPAHSIYTGRRRVSCVLCVVHEYSVCCTHTGAACMHAVVEYIATCSHMCTQPV